MIKIGDKAKLIKLTDDYFNGNHPNFINEGHIEKAIINSLPEVGKRYYFSWDFSTSVVKEPLNEEGIFKTTYSTYKLEKIE